MIPTEVFDVFAQGDSIPLMAQAAMENALSPRLLDRLFEDTAQRQFTRDLLFSSVVGLMSVVVCRARPSINAAYRKGAVPIPVSLRAFYGKRPDALPGGISHAHPRRQSPARQRAPDQGVAHPPGRGTARAHPGRARP